MPDLTGTSANYDAQKVKTVTDSGNPVKRRITSIEAARHLVDITKREFTSTGERNARLKAQIDGAPPYEQARLDELALGHMTNQNFLELHSILSQKASQWHEIFHEVPTIAEFERAPGTPIEYNDHCGVIAEEFHRTMMDWTGFLPLMDKVRREADAYAIGPAVFYDKYDWRPKAFSSGSLYYDPRAKLDPETMEYFILEDGDVTAGDLYRWAFTNEKGAEKEGWNLPAVKALLASVFAQEEQQDSQGRMYAVSQWEDVQQRIRNGNWFSEIKEFERVKLVHLFIREVKSGKLSHYVFSEKELADTSRSDVKDDFLFKEEDAYDNVSNVLWYLPADGGDGFLKSVRGLASKIEAHCDLSNRYLGRVYDAGFMSASVMLQPRSPTDYAKAQMIRAGVMTILPPGFEVIQKSTMAPNVADLIPLRDLSLSIMRNNTGVWREHPEITAEREANKTARQVAEESAKEARFEKAAVQFDYGYLERLYREIWRRLTNPVYLSSDRDRPGRAEALDFMRRIVLRGVPQNILPSLGSLFILHVTRAIGMGSWGLKLDISNQVLSLANSMDEAGRRTALRDRAGVLVGYRNVDRYFPVVNRDTIASDASSHAFLENNDMREGQEARATSDQEHVPHLVVHNPILVEIIKVVQGGAVQDPRRLLMTLQAALKHVNEHWQFISADPTRRNLAEMTEQLLKEAAELVKPLAAQVMKLQAAEEKIRQAQGEVVDEARSALQAREQELRAMEIQSKAETERMKQDSLNQMRRDKTEDQDAINRKRAAGELQLKAERQAAELELERQKVAQKGEK